MALLVALETAPDTSPGPQELVSEVVEAGKPAPESVMARWVAGAGYVVCVDFLNESQIISQNEARKVKEQWCLRHDCSFF